MVNSKTLLIASKNLLKETNFSFLGKRLTGKVRDFYILDDKRILITTDRQSAFNAILGCIPYKGAVLNLLSKFWFEKTKQISTNHMISVPHPNVMIARNCESIPIEMVVRGYLTGVTVTSPWGNYERGERVIYGIKFPDGLRKNQKLPNPILTPTTHGGAKGSHADERLTREEIISRNLIDKKIYLKMEKIANELFKFGSRVCKRQGLILVDTKYEFGLQNGKLMLIDEIHTPDSSRFWIADSYKSRFKNGLEPENYDKEFLRLWYAKHGYRGDGIPPKMPESLMIALSKRYIGVYEKLTGQKFNPMTYPLTKSIIEVLKNIKN